MFFPSLEPPWSDLIDIALVAALVYAATVSLRGARAHLALLGLGILGCVYLIARQLGLELTAWLFQAFFAAFLVVLVVIFQNELRQGFERIAVWGLGRGRISARLSDHSEPLVRALADLSAMKRGAIVVLRGRDPLERHVQGGVALNGEVSEPLLLSLFDPHSPGHDGAVMIEGQRVVRFAAHLPLSSSFEKLGLRGTRHAAALGLAERTDALCIVVSEERGSISVAQGGELDELDQPSELTARLRAFADEPVGRRPERAGWLALLRANGREIALAIGASALLWVLVVPGSKVARTSVRVNIVVENLPEGFTLEGVDPPDVEVTVTGLRRDLFLLDPRQFEAHVDGFLVGIGRRTFELSPDAVRRPPGLEVAALEPRSVRLRVAELEQPVGGATP